MSQKSIPVRVGTSTHIQLTSIKDIHNLNSLSDAIDHLINENKKLDDRVKWLLDRQVETKPGFGY